MKECKRGDVTIHRTHTCTHICSKYMALEMALSTSLIISRKRI